MRVCVHFFAENKSISVFNQADFDETRWLTMELNQLSSIDINHL